ncbi:hypothetical protein [Streptomyces sp. NPDC018045]|uniref:hypothetical protein n=1 Tax=Streptomyces sp. NPDC018045 TaxID=3365037 RepID=UPI003792EA81
MDTTSARPDGAGPDWGQRIRDARAAKDHANTVYEQTIRDAHAAGRSVSAMANDLGQKSRKLLTAIVGRTAGDVPPVALPVVVYLSGRGRSDATWAEMRAAMHARGWYAVSHELTAWHLSRGGATCVHVYFGSGRPVSVTLEEAVYAQPYDQPLSVAELLPTTAAISLERAHPEAAAFQVSVATRETDWKRMAGRGERPAPERYDEERINNTGRPGAVVLDVAQVARWIADLLE